MQTIKKVVPGRGAVYSKPTKAQGGYTPIRKNMNNWYFSDLARNVSEQVLEMGEAYNARLKAGGRHLNSHPIQLIRYVYFLYLSGGRLMEPLSGECPPRISLLSNAEGKVYIEVEKANEKHKAPDGSPDKLTQVLPVFNAAEQRMWNFITDGGLLLNSDEIFEFKDWKSTTHDNLSNLIKYNFRTDLRDTTGKLHKDQGITPHILRHMRAYSVIVNYGVEPAYAIELFGWRNERMLYYYAHIRGRLKASSQLQMLKRGNFLTGLHIDLGKAIAGY